MPDLFFYWSPVLAVVFSDVLYQVCARKMSEGENPLAPLFGSYAAAALLCFFLFLTVVPEARLSLSVSGISPMVFFVGPAIAGLEIGSVYMYRNGWSMNVGFTLFTAATVVVLFLIGAAFYGESVTFLRLAGAVTAMAGIYLVVNES